jgi:hypothetical protein
MATKKNNATTPSEPKTTETVATTPSEPTTTETVAATPSEPTTTEIVEGIDKAINDFFVENPKALSLLKVGDEIFFGTAHGAAHEFAVKNELIVERIANPFLEEVA